MWSCDCLMLMVGRVALITWTLEKCSQRNMEKELTSSSHSITAQGLSLLTNKFRVSMRYAVLGVLYRAVS